MPNCRACEPLRAREEQTATDAHRRSEYELFWQVWSLHHEYLFNLSLRWMGGNRADAEDALSSTKLKAVVHYGPCAALIRNDRAWLSRLLYNSCMDLYRRRSSSAEAGSLNFEGLIEVAVLAVPAGTAEEALLERELIGRIGQLLEELPQAWQHAFVERCMRQRPYPDVAAEAGTTEANIRKRVQLARAFLRDRLAAGRPAGFHKQGAMSS